MSCRCYEIGGPFIGADPDCAKHGTHAQAEQAQREEAEERQLKALEQQAIASEHATLERNRRATRNFYQMAINNVARKIRSQGEDQEHRLNAFDASVYLAAAFCKMPEEVIVDIVNVDKVCREVKS